VTSPLKSSNPSVAEPLKSSTEGIPPPDPSIASSSTVISPIKALADFSLKSHAYYPTLNRTLAVLTKLYLSVDNDAFDIIALTATNACVASLKKASQRVVAKAGTVDGALFLLSHLFVLEMKLRPFDINFISTETSLDFSSIISAVKALLTGQKSLFALSRDNALYNVIASSAPRVKTIQVDSKKEMETLAQQTSDDLIDSLSTELLHEVSTFVVQSNAILNSAMNSGNASIAMTSSKLKEMQFAKPEKVNELVTKFDSSIKAKLPPFMDKLRLYCAATIDRQRIFKPLKTKILDTTSRLKQILNREYSANDVSAASVSILDSTTLSRFLDSTLLSNSFSV